MIVQLWKSLKILEDCCHSTKFQSPNVNFSHYLLNKKIYNGSIEWILACTITVNLRQVFVENLWF